MPTLKASELSGRALDWAVALALGTKPVYDWEAFGTKHIGAWETSPDGGRNARMLPLYSRDNRDAPPTVYDYLAHSGPDPVNGWYARGFGDSRKFYGPSRLIALCRLYVADHVGDVVEIPEELCRD